MIGTFRPLNSILCVSTSSAFCVLILSAVCGNLLALINRTAALFVGFCLLAFFLSRCN